MSNSSEPDVPGLPIGLGAASNGEFVPRPPGPVQREAVRRTLDHAERAARRRGIDRRRFLQTLAGSATALFLLDACSKDEARSRGEEPGGTFSVPEDATDDEDAARDLLGPDELVFDVQTHLLDEELLRDGALFFAAPYPQAACTDEDDPRDCFSLRHYVEEMFVRSDTSMAVISAIPIPGDANPLPIALMEETRDAVDRLCGDGRVLLHGLVLPQSGGLDATLDGMRTLAERHAIGAWKTYTHVPGPGWWLDDRDAEGPQVGEELMRAVAASDTPILCVHKGLNLGVPGDAVKPLDIGPAAAAHPDVAVVTYHSGFDTERTEGPLSEDAPSGVDELVLSLRDAGIGPGENVYAELGGTWWFAMRNPDAAAHLLGKLLLAVGEDRILWGTDSIWFGSPQDQIEAFRTFEITERLQEEHGYPALTPEVKHKVLGQNALALYGVEPPADFCAPDPDHVSELRSALPPRRTYGPRTTTQLRSLLRSHGAIG